MSLIKSRIGLMRELMQTRVVMMEANALHNYRTRILHNFNTHNTADTLVEEMPQKERHYMLTFNKDTGKPTRVAFFNQNNVLCEADADGNEIAAKDPQEDERQVLMLEMCGPVTRSGGWCSYGSIDFRDLLTEYADDDKVVGMVLITDTPGGTAFALHDFRQGMDAWDAAGKRSIQWIDGMSCSAGVALGAQCQKIVAMNGHDIVGCVGAMMAGWTTADGATDQDGHRYVDVTATQTPDKNAEYRTAAVGDYEGLQKEVDECASQFLDILDKCRPQVTPEQRTGHTYEAKDVIGTLVDGIGTLETAIEYALNGNETWDVPEQNDEDNAQPDTPEQPDEDNAQTDNDEPQPEHPEEPEQPDSDENTDANNAVNEQLAQLTRLVENLTARLAEATEATAALREENRTLMDAAPAPATPAPAPRHKQEEAPTRIAEGMTAAQKLAAWKRRGEQLNNKR